MLRASCFVLRASCFVLRASCKLCSFGKLRPLQSNPARTILPVTDSKEGTQTPSALTMPERTFTSLQSTHTFPFSQKTSLCFSVRRGDLFFHTRKRIHIVGGALTKKVTKGACFCTYSGSPYGFRSMFFLKEFNYEANKKDFQNLRQCLHTPITKCIAAYSPVSNWGRSTCATDL